MEMIERFRGCLLGLAAGDALGTTLEFKPPGSFPPLTGMVGGGPFGLQPGQWTDDTSMALCLAESLLECGGFDPADQMQRYLRWRREGHLSATGACFDIGNTISAALSRYERTRQPYCGSQDPYTAGNGSLMRLAPVPMYYARQPELAMQKSGESSLTTHGLQVTTDACRYFGGLLVGALSGVSKQILLSEAYAPLTGYWQAHPLHPEIQAVAAGSFKHKMPPDLRGDGYVVHSLEAALWAVHHSRSFEHGALLAVNLGEDADTTGAIYGQLAGALYGEAGIPAAWRDLLALKDDIRSFAEKLYGRAMEVVEE